VPDLALTCDDVRVSAAHVVFVRTFTGHAAGTGDPIKAQGWEEWDLAPDLKVRTSRGWFDAEAYDRRAGG
jgi:hypothetical protein